MIQVFDQDYVEELKKQGLKVVNKTDQFTLMALSDKVNFSMLDSKKCRPTNKMTF